jgi:hypothetical protein
LSRKIYLIVILLLVVSIARSQDTPAEHSHDSQAERANTSQHDHGQQGKASSTADHDHMQHDGVDDMHDMPGMRHDCSHHGYLHEDRSQDYALFSSGTSWQPLCTPEHMWMTGLGGWDLMAHGNAFLTYNQQPRPVSAGKFESQNWIMLMEHEQISAATVTFRQMLSAEPFTAPKAGFGEVFQTGETVHGAPLVNFQHPHDFFSELSALFTVSGNRIVWLLYGAVAGEPALGPTGFPHRLSAMEIPAAPLSHHLQDSTHVSFGVVTLGGIAGRFKFEGSAFNGREPDEHRYNFDFAALDSFSGRISVAPTQNLTAQYSFGHLHHPEALEPGDINRQTASIDYNRTLTNGNWATSLIWGRNDKTAIGRTENSYLLESSLNFATRNYAFTRLELVDKDELEIPASIAPLGASFRIGGFTFGGVRDLIHNSTGQVGLGAALTFYSKPPPLDAVYGRHPVAFQIFLRLRPGLMNMHHF